MAKQTRRDVASDDTTWHEDGIVSLDDPDGESAFATLAVGRFMSAENPHAYLVECMRSSANPRRNF
ncbi:MAG: hypothetical protein WA001_04720 [Patescibacteria group bacterium]